MLVLLLFILIFAIIGINLFKGTFFYCTFDNIPHNHYSELKALMSNVDTKFDCINLGGSWINRNENFDNIGSAILTLFELMITEGW